jgi:hypothetical protein
VTLDVRERAYAFAQEVQDLLDAVLPIPDGADPADRRIQVQAAANGRYSVRPAVSNGLVTLISDEDPVASLRVSYLCTADTELTYLAVQKSSFELLGFNDRTPIARLDYIRDANRVPAAHWNIHGERGTTSRLLGRTNPDHAGALSALHFPVGGARMRPCLEDVLHFLAHEFCIDTLPTAVDAIAAGREGWRRKQIAVLVRDAPDVAVRVLEKMGYQVALPVDGVREANALALRRW